MFEDRGLAMRRIGLGDVTTDTLLLAIAFRQTATGPEQSDRGPRQPPKGDRFDSGACDSGQRQQRTPTGGTATGLPPSPTQAPRKGTA
jgi:hypothetical protein